MFHRTRKYRARVRIDQSGQQITTVRLDRDSTDRWCDLFRRDARDRAVDHNHRCVFYGRCRPTVDEGCTNNSERRRSVLGFESDCKCEDKAKTNDVCETHDIKLVHLIEAGVISLMTPVLFVTVFVVYDRTGKVFIPGLCLRR